MWNLYFSFSWFPKQARSRAARIRPLPQSQVRSNHKIFRGVILNPMDTVTDDDYPIHCFQVIPTSPPPSGPLLQQIHCKGQNLFPTCHKNWNFQIHFVFKMCHNDKYSQNLGSPEDLFCSSKKQIPIFEDISLSVREHCHALETLALFTINLKQISNYLLREQSQSPGSSPGSPRSSNPGPRPSPLANTCKPS